MLRLSFLRSQGTDLGTFSGREKMRPGRVWRKVAVLTRRGEARADQKKWRRVDAPGGRRCLGRWTGTREYETGGAVCGEGERDGPSTSSTRKEGGQVHFEREGDRN